MKNEEIARKILEILDSELHKKLGDKGTNLFCTLLQSPYPNEYFQDAFMEIGKAIYSDLVKIKVSEFKVEFRITGDSSYLETKYLERLHLRLYGTSRQESSSPPEKCTINIYLDADEYKYQRLWEFTISKNDTGEIQVDIIKNEDRNGYHSDARKG